MDVYILDSLLRRTEVVDAYESAIWTERYSSFGDFEIDIKSTLKARGQFQAGTQLSVNNSYDVMTVETVEDTVDAEGKDILKVKGRSFQAILMDRIAMDTLTSPTWTLVDTPGNVARTMFDHVVRTGALCSDDQIPFLMPGTYFAAGTNGESSESITWVQQPADLYSAIKNVCDPYDLGFRFVRNFDASQLYFEVYTGDDRTTRQTIKPAVVFAPGLDNIQNTSELTNIQGSKNVAYVYSEAGSLVVYGENVDPDVAGFDRRVLVVNTNVAVDDPDANTLMQEAGRQALAGYRAIQLFDGEVSQYGTFQYNVDYGLGDIVEMRNKDGIITYKRVTEHIFVSDAQGDRSYPTLTSDLFLGTNTWLSWNNKPTVWADYDLDFDSVWANQ